MQIGISKFSPVECLAPGRAESVTCPCFAEGVAQDLAPLGEADNETPFAIAIDTSDPDVRDAIFRLLAETGGLAMQSRLFDIAVEPGRARVRLSAAHALLQAAEQLDRVIIDKISPRLLAARNEPVAGVLAILVAWQGEIASVRTAAEEIAANAKAQGGCSSS